MSAPLVTPRELDDCRKRIPLADKHLYLAAREIERLNALIATGREQREKLGTCPEAYWEQRALAAEGQVQRVREALVQLEARPDPSPADTHGQLQMSGERFAAKSIRAALDPEVPA